MKKNEQKLIPQEAQNLAQEKEEVQKSCEENVAVDNDLEAFKENIKTLEEEKKV